MTDLQKMRAKALATATLLPGSDHKRFVGQMAALALANPGKGLTPKQAEHLARLSWRYRKQMPPPLVPAQDPDTLGKSNVTEGMEEEDYA